MTKQLPRGYAGASDHLRIDIINRFGGLYADGDNSFPTGRENPGHLTTAGPTTIPELFDRVARSEPGFSLTRRGNGLLTNDAVVAPAGHPALALWLECARLNYYRSERHLMGGTTAMAGRYPSIAEAQRPPGAGTAGEGVDGLFGPAWRWAVTPARSGRVHHTVLARLGLDGAALPPLAPALREGSELSWVPPEGPEPALPCRPEDAVGVLTTCLAYLRWQLLNREGDLHLTGVAPMVRGLPDPDLAWTALLMALPRVTTDLRPVTSVTDRRRNADGTVDTVTLPPEAEALLDRTATPARWLGAELGTREAWLLAERVVPVALRPPS